MAGGIDVVFRALVLVRLPEFTKLIFDRDSTSDSGIGFCED